MMELSFLALNIVIEITMEADNATKYVIIIYFLSPVHGNLHLLKLALLQSIVFLWFLCKFSTSIEQ